MENTEKEGNLEKIADETDKLAKEVLEEVQLAKDQNEIIRIGMAEIEKEKLDKARF